MLDETQKAAAALLGGHSTVDETATKLEIPAETVRGYLSDPEFSAEVSSQRDAAETATEEAVQKEAARAFGIPEVR